MSEQRLPLFCRARAGTAPSGRMLRRYGWLRMRPLQCTTPLGGPDPNGRRGTGPRSTGERRYLQGFTAIEFIVAISMIFVGSLVVFHYCRVAMPIARTSSCASNVKQMGIALLSYATDNDGCLPAQGVRDWASVVAHVKNRQVLVCPQAPRQPAGDSSTAPHSDYVLNYRLRSDDRPTLLLVADDVPNRHAGHWVGARLDLACFIWPEREWNANMGWVIENAAPAPAR